MITVMLNTKISINLKFPD